jgi:hypothetical protein
LADKVEFLFDYIKQLKHPSLLENLLSFQKVIFRLI